ncbi:TPA: SprT family zinc-dependent metalloprotease [Pasteurella multocida]|nr:SprT family zinc-dependent metalloprotease [Pasteurella multocida]
MQQETHLRHLKMQVQRKLHQCLQVAEAYFHRQFSIPNINYKVRGMKAGIAYLQHNEIRLNPILLLENSEEFIGEVVPHELAHLLVYQLFGRVKPHGKEWKNIMQNVFHLEPQIYHQFDTSNVVKSVFPYECGCKVHYLTIRRHNNIQNGQIMCFCKECKFKLRFKP